MRHQSGDESDPGGRSEPSVEVERLERCPACGSDRFDDWCRSFDKLTSVSQQSFTYARCRACDVLFERVRPAEKEIGRFYPDSYTPHGGSGGPDADSRRPRNRLARLLVRSTTRLVLNPLSRLVWAGLAPRESAQRSDGFQQHQDRFYAEVREGTRFLDYGCGSDGFLNRMREQGAETWGTDASEKVLERVRTSGHHTIPLSELHVRGAYERFFDRIRMNHVIEHLYQPSLVVSDLGRIIRPGGSIHVATPNAESPFARWFKASWFNLDCPRHTVIFSPRALADLFARAGFEEIVVADEMKELDLVRSWSYFLVDRSLRKAPYTRFVESRNLRWLSRPAKAWAESRGAGDRIHLFARRSPTPGTGDMRPNRAVF